MIAKDAPFSAFKNRSRLQGDCDCYHCLKTFHVEDIKDWTDGGETAICPHCNVDSVIPTCANLQEIHQHWFG